MTRIAVLALLGLAATASAQTQTAAVNPWTRCTTLEVLGGTATASPNITATFGAGVGWELTHRTEIQGVAVWLASHDGADAFAADLKLLVNVRRPAAVVPYVGGGAGLYRSAFDRQSASLPDFYRRRMPSSAVTNRMTFTDPTALLAAGAHVYVARHFSIRPEVSVRLIVDDARTYSVTSVTFALAYHAEEHAVGDSRGHR